MKKVFSFGIIAAALIFTSCHDQKTLYGDIHYAVATTNSTIVSTTRVWEETTFNGTFVAKPLNGGTEIVIDFPSNETVNKGDTVAYTTHVDRDNSVDVICYDYRGKK